MRFFPKEVAAAPIAALLASVFASAPLHAETLAVRGNRLWVPVEIGDQRIEALLDSGAEVTVIDNAQWRALGRDTQDSITAEAHGTGAQSMEARLVENLSLTAIGRTITVPTAAVMDLSEVAARLTGGQLPVVLGRDIFDAGRLAIDIAAGTIDWAAQGPTPAGTPLTLTSAHGIETIPVSFGGLAAQADFDLGNGTGLLISRDLARRIGARPAGVEPGGGIGGTAPRMVVYVPELTIAGHRFTAVRAHVAETMKVDANVGVDLLRSFRITTDFPERTVWLEAR